jgi:hypothetical protein
MKRKIDTAAVKHANEASFYIPEEYVINGADKRKVWDIAYKAFQLGVKLGKRIKNLEGKPK